MGSAGGGRTDKKLITEASHKDRQWKARSLAGRLRGRQKQKCDLHEYISARS